MHPSHWQQDLHCIHCCALMQDIGIGWCRDLFPAFHILPLILLLLSLAYQRRNAHSGGDLMRDGAHHFFSQIFGVYTCFHLVLCARYSNHSVPIHISAWMTTAPQAQNIALILGGGLVPPSLSSLGNYVAASACYSQLSADCVVGASGVPVHLSIASKSWVIFKVESAEFRFT